MEELFIANEVIDDEKKRAILISVCGKDCYDFLINFVRSVKFRDKFYDELCAVFKGYIEFKSLEIMERYNFYNIIRRDEESVITFMVRLRRAAVYCNFGISVDIMLRD